ncbi:MAG: N-acetylmuramoyl-L-alanine amidase, partial [Syntrophaceae bacterium]|nr:N-acetylmuramoyl-L-alanine amidase [Syntrophaceae bacterium]
MIKNDAPQSEQAMNQAASAFVDLQKTEKGANKVYCRFFAGKAYLNLYKLSSNPEHLDICIKNFNDFKKSLHNHKYYKEALFDLREAYLLKRKTKSSKTPKTGTPLADKITNQAPKNSEGGCPTNNLQIKAVMEANACQSLDKSEGPQSQSPQFSDRTPLNPVGNPFFQSDLRCVEPQQRQIKLKSASLTPQVLTDVKPAKNNPEVIDHKNGPVIVIDPGHGGKDPGAVSSDGKVTEKEIVLEIAKLLKKRLEETYPNTKVFLTRNDDSFLSLKERAKIANSLDAEVFISVHCNGSDFKSASGPEIFYLSKSSSRGAMRAAARENGVSLSKMTDLEATLVDLLTTSKNSESNKLAEVVHDSLTATDSGSGIKFRDRGVKQAPFYVLIGATMPAILVECGFVNNLAQKNIDSRE